VLLIRALTETVTPRGGVARVGDHLPGQRVVVLPKIY